MCMCTYVCVAIPVSSELAAGRCQYRHAISVRQRGCVNSKRRSGCLPDGSGHPYQTHAAGARALRHTTACTPDVLTRIPAQAQSRGLPRTPASTPTRADIVKHAHTYIHTHTQLRRTRHRASLPTKVYCSHAHARRVVCVFALCAPRTGILWTR
jgi:hypothetical protein